MQYLFGTNTYLIDMESLSDKPLKEGVTEAFSHMYTHAWGSYPDLSRLTPVEESIIASLMGNFKRQYWSLGSEEICSGAPYGVICCGNLYLFVWCEPYEGISTGEAQYLNLK